MKNHLWAICLLVFMLPVVALSQTSEEIAAKQAVLEERARESVSTLDALITSRALVQKEITDLSAQAESANEADKEQVLAELEARRTHLAEIEDQISVLATGVSESEFDKREPAAFDLQNELEALVQPFIVMMRNATEEARQIEATRRGLAEAEQRLNTARQAIETLAVMRKAATGDALAADLAERETVWSERAVAAETSVAALKQQLEDLLDQRVTAGTQV